MCPVLVPPQITAILSAKEENFLFTNYQTLPSLIQIVFFRFKCQESKSDAAAESSENFHIVCPVLPLSSFLRTAQTILFSLCLKQTIFRILNYKNERCILQVQKHDQRVDVKPLAQHYTVQKVSDQALKIGSLLLSHLILVMPPPFSVGQPLILQLSPILNQWFNGWFSLHNVLDLWSPSLSPSHLFQVLHPLLPCIPAHLSL